MKEMERVDLRVNKDDKKAMSKDGASKLSQEGSGIYGMMQNVQGFFQNQM
jgi:hypothetical protein